MNAFGYSDAVWRLFNETPRAGRFDDSQDVATGRAATPGGARVLALHLRIRSGEVADARFEALGCPTTIAVAAWLAEQAVGRAPDDLRQLQAAAIRQALEIPDDRAHCALLGEDAMAAALAAAGN